jgi:membrane protease subunit (stomatin/prohibitin family)
MGLFNWLQKQTVDRIEWTDDSQETMVYRFRRHDKAIQYGAKLTVRESQMALFYNKGEVADILTPGIYKLETNNVPVLTSLQRWNHNFESPFKAEIYFVNMKHFCNLKWATKNPIMVRDSEFNMVNLDASGTFEIRVVDVKKFMSEVVGTDAHFTVEEITPQLTTIILSKFTSILSEGNIPVLDLAQNYDDVANYMKEHIAPLFAPYGVELTNLHVEMITLPEEVKKALDERNSQQGVEHREAPQTTKLKQPKEETTPQEVLPSNSPTPTATIQQPREEHSTQHQETIPHTAQSVHSEEPKEMVQHSSPEMSHTTTQTSNDSMEPTKVVQEEYSAPSAHTTQQETTQHHQHNDNASTHTMGDFYVALESKPEGPYAIEEIIQDIKSGVIQKDTLIWTEGMSDWSDAVSLFSQHFNTTD